MIKSLFIAVKKFHNKIKQTIKKNVLIACKIRQFYILTDYKSFTLERKMLTNMCYDIVLLRNTEYQNIWKLSRSMISLNESHRYINKQVSNFS